MTTKNILIVGDWFIDEYWFLARHYSEVSSHTGPMHYRIFSDMHEPVRGLCGAGLVTRVLYELDVEAQSFSLFGIGVWNASDTQYLRHLIHAPNNNNNKRPDSDDFCHSTCAPFIVCIDERMRNSVGDQVPDRIHLTTLDNNSATVRIIRQYDIRNNEFYQINRIDWAPQRKSKDKDTTLSQEVTNQLPHKIDVIVIDDHHKKGVINPDVIKGILDKYRDNRPATYVRTKNRDVITDASPEWFKNIPNMKLLVLGPEVCSRYVPPGRILTRSGQITRYVYELLDHFRPANTQPRQSENIVLVSDELEVAALLSDNCFVTKAGRAIKDTDLEGVGFTTSLFASLIYTMQADTDPEFPGSDPGKIKTRLEKLIATAYDKAHVPTPKSLGSAPKEDGHSSQGTGPKIEVRHLGAWTKISKDWHSAVEYDPEQPPHMGIVGLP